MYCAICCVKLFILLYLEPMDTVKFIVWKSTLGVRIAEWLASRITKQEGPGSNPGGVKEI